MRFVSTAEKFLSVAPQRGWNLIMGGSDDVRAKQIYLWLPGGGGGGTWATSELMLFISIVSAKRTQYREEVHPGFSLQFLVLVFFFFFYVTV